MVIEIKSSSGHGMRTENPKCLYPLETLKNMQASGYAFYVDGKKVSLAQIAEIAGVAEDKPKKRTRS